MPDEKEAKTLYLIICAAPPASETHHLAELARERGWDVHVLATPDALAWIDRDALAGLTGNPPRSEYRLPGEAKSLPSADVVVVAPATFNTINKFRYGIADNFAVGVLCECLQAEVPIVIAPNVKAVLAEHPAFEDSLRQLAEWGVQVLPQADFEGGSRMASWDDILAAAERDTDGKPVRPADMPDAPRNHAP